MVDVVLLAVTRWHHVFDIVLLTVPRWHRVVDIVSSAVSGWHHVIDVVLLAVTRWHHVVAIVLLTVPRWHYMVDVVLLIITRWHHMVDVVPLTVPRWCHVVDCDITRCHHTVVLSAVPIGGPYRRSLLRVSCVVALSVARWHRLRLNMLPLVAGLLEPLGESITLGLYMSWSMWHFFSISPYVWFSGHWAVWCLLDYIQLTGVQVRG